MSKKKKKITANSKADISSLDHMETLFVSVYISVLFFSCVCVYETIWRMMVPQQRGQRFGRQVSRRWWGTSGAEHLEIKKQTRGCGAAVQRHASSSSDFCIFFFHNVWVLPYKLMTWTFLGHKKTNDWRQISPQCLPSVCSLTNVHSSFYQKKKKNYLSLRVKGQVVFLYFRSGNNKTCRRADVPMSKPVRAALKNNFVHMIKCLSLNWLERQRLNHVSCWIVVNSSILWGQKSNNSPDQSNYSWLTHLTKLMAQIRPVSSKYHTFIWPTYGVRWWHLGGPPTVVYKQNWPTYGPRGGRGQHFGLKGPIWVTSAVFDPLFWFTLKSHKPHIHYMRWNWHNQMFYVVNTTALRTGSGLRISNQQPRPSSH